MQKIFTGVLLGWCLFALPACSKDYLDKKPDQQLIVPSTLSDFQSLFDNVTIMNSSPGLPVISGDDYFATTDGWLGWSTETEKNSYIWAPDLYENQSCPDWDGLYQEIFYANVVLDGLNAGNGSADSVAQQDQVRGSALFYRSMAFYQLAQLFAKPYAASTSASDPGILVKLGSDVNQPAVRYTVQKSYDQMIADLQLAVQWLPVKTPFASRPSRAACYALLARIYQTMQSYDRSVTYADSSLALNHALIDFNTLDSTSDRPLPSALPNQNPEVLFASWTVPYSFFYAALTYVDSSLYNSYSAGDLRRVMYFAGDGSGYSYFKGSYSGETYSYFIFSGLAVDELYLIRAEGYARAGNKDSALADLNTLLRNRYRQGQFVPLTAGTPDSALALVLTERRKELVSRGLRWTDLRRLNLDPRFATTLTRNINNQSYTLPPGSPLYTLPLPNTELSAGVQQNPR